VKFLSIVFFLISFALSDDYKPYPLYQLEMNKKQEKVFYDGFLQTHTQIQDLSPLEIDNPNLVNVKETIPWKTQTLASVEYGYVWKTIPYKVHGALRYIFVVSHPNSESIGLYEIGTDRSFFRIKTFYGVSLSSNDILHYIVDNKKYYFKNKTTNEFFVYTLNSKEKMKKIKHLVSQQFSTEPSMGAIISHDASMTLDAEWTVEKYYHESDYTNEDGSDSDITIQGLKITNNNNHQEKILFSYQVHSNSDGWYIGHTLFSENDSNIYFDNAGGFACIWKYAFQGKTLEKIVPEHKTDLLKVFSYKNKDYILYVEEDVDKIIFKIATE